MSGQQPLALRQVIAAWSDRVQTEAAGFADKHRDLLPRRITNAQLYGLANVVRSAHNYSQIQRFVEHQGEKASRAARGDVQAYWADLGKNLTALRGEAQRLLKQVPLEPGSRPPQSLDALHRQLASEYVQHLIAHSLYWTPEAEGRGYH